MLIHTDKLSDSKLRGTIKYGSAVSISKENMRDWMKEMNEFYAELEAIANADDLGAEQRLEQALAIYNTMLSNDVFSEKAGQKYDDLLLSRASILRDRPYMALATEWYSKQEVSRQQIAEFHKRKTQNYGEQDQRRYKENPEKEMADFVLSQIYSTILFYSLSRLENKAEYVSKVGSRGIFRFQEGGLGVLVICCQNEQPNGAMLFDEATIASLPQLDVMHGRMLRMNDIETGYDWEL